MLSGEALSEVWVARLASARAAPSLEGRGASDATVTPGRVAASAVARLERMTGGSAAGRYLVLVAATRLVLAALDPEGTRPPVLMPSPTGRGELALCAPLDGAAPVGDFLTALHRELESAAPLAWTDRARVVERLAAADPTAAAAVGGLGVVWDDDRLTASLLVSARRGRDGLTVSVLGPERPPAAASLARCVAAAITAVVAAPHQRCAEVDVVGAEQRAELAAWSGLSRLGALPARTLVDVLDTSAARWPGRPAVVTPTTVLSHAELAGLATRAAAVLAGRHGVGGGDRVALLLPRGPELVTVMHAVLRAGASFVPLDPEHPPARWARQLRLSGARWVVTGDGVDIGTPDVERLDAAALLTGPAAPAPAGPGPDDEAVLFFTSGSTGPPRPVAIRHRQLAHKAVSSAEHVGFDEHTRIAMLAAISSDMLAYHVFTTMAAGGGVVPMNGLSGMDPGEFWAHLRKMEINALNCVPTLLSVMAEGPGAEHPLRHCFVGGDLVPAGLPARLARRLRIGTFANLYGPTEATIEAVGFVCDGADLAGLTSVPIGRPSPGYAVAVLTPGGELAPAGVPGEIHVLGPAVADGYRDEAPTGPGRFVDLAVAPGVPAFRTGDFGRWRGDGQLEFLGRRDRQVQIHGNRVELGEIEAALAALPGIGTGAVVVVRHEGRPPLIVAAHTGDLPAEAVRGWLTARLPPVMVPALIVHTDPIPLTPHGKVDARAVAAVAEGADEVWRPGDADGRLVAAAWAEVLGRPPRTADQDFFTAGGHSLGAAQLAGALYAAAGGRQLTVRQIFDAPTPRGLAAALRACAVPRPAPRARPGRLPASSAQRRLWLLEERGGRGPRPYRMVESYRPRQAVEPEALERALNRLVARHEALRTVLTLVDGRLEQRVLSPERARVRLVVSGRPLAEVAAAEQRRRTALDEPPVLRAHWLTGDGVLVLSVHHSVCDGWSFGVLLRDLGVFLDPGAPAEPPAPVQYADHGLELAARDTTAALRFWRDALAGLPDVPLPLDRRREAARGTEAHTVRRPLDASTAGGLRALRAGLGVTSFPVVVAAVRVLLLRLCHAEDIALGTIVSGRDDPRLAHSVGFFANTVVLRTRVDPERGFADLVRAVAETAGAARPHQELPFGELVDALVDDRVPGRNPLFDVLVEAPFAGVPGVLDADRPARWEHLPLDAGVTGFDLTIGVTEPAAGAPEIVLSCPRDVFDHATARRLADQLRVLLAELVADPMAPVGGFRSLPEDQTAELIAAGTGPALAVDRELTLVDLVAERVGVSPDAVAVVHGDRSLTFRALDEAAGRLAARIAAAAPVGPDRIVGVVCERTERMVTALLAVARTGAAFLPLDPAQPALRRAALLRDSGAVAVLTDPGGEGAAFDGLGVPVIPLDDRPGPDLPALPRPSAGDLAYVVATSGSTGTPKGVMVEHRAIVNTVLHRVGHYGLTGRDAMLQVDPVHFDAGIADVFTALTVGCPQVVLGRDQLLDPAALSAAIRRHRISHMMLVPSLYALLLDTGTPAPRALRQVVLGGERVTEALVARHRALAPDTELHNDYGPAENAVTATLCRVDGLTGEVPIGTPVANQWADLLDADGRLVPFGAVGEICLGGAGLARGYLADPAGTARRFGPSPVRNGARMYRTGDLAVRMSDGRLRYVGRMDDQVKIRGQRVEPGEVGAVLARADGVRQAAVLALGEPEPRLVAYFAGDAEPAALRAFLAQRLPPAMVPEVCVRVDALPVTANGKLDRAALPPPAAAPAAPAGPPFTPAQRRVAEVWADLLGRPVTELDESLFRLGGHSLTAARIGLRLGVPVSEVFGNPTVRQLAAVLPDRIAEPAVPARGGAGPFPLSHAQLRVWLAARRTTPDPFVIATVTATGRRLDPDVLRTALGAVMRRQQVLRLRVKGEGTRVRQTVLDEVEVPLVVVELPGVAPDGPEVDAALRAGRAVSFDPGRAPLFQLRLLTGPVGGDLLMVTAHHLIHDGASGQILLDDLWRAYDRVLAGEDATLPPLSHTFLDEVAAERTWLAGAEAADEIAFWRDRLAGAPPSPDPVDPARRDVTRGDTGLARTTLPWDAVAGASATPFALVVTAFTAALARATGVRDLVLGFAAGLRRHPAADAVVGYLANAVPLRLRYGDRASLGELLAEVTARTAEAYQHGRVPFDVLAQRLGLLAPPGRSVLLDLGVSWENAVVGDERHQLRDVLPERLPATSDLWLYASRRGDRLRLDLTYDDALVRPAEARDLVDRVRSLCTEAVTRPATPVDPGAHFDDRPSSWTGTRYDL
ncbi:non-ribosomal peptide synthetase [Streptomyces sp. NBRC 109706]|uniref:non-ribosomal peptide synthetase n=1 Tax=Streptomyces sp. NBRC 109706 TaxID=1550035 RepID=UPI000784A89E|nr:non-ribosomal peptide synthetase [Streptomyces sp. NBRC 109706]